MNFRLFPKEQGLMPFIWVTFLAFPLIALFPYDTLDKKIALLSLLIFSIAYRNAYFPEKKVIFWIVLQQIIAVLYCWMYGYIALLIFPGYFIGYMVTEKRKFWQMTVLHWVIITGCVVYTLFMDKPSFFNLYYGTMNLIFGAMSLINPFVGRKFVVEYYHRLQDMQIKKRSESFIKHEERQRIARDLHDTLGQSLSIMTLKSELAGKLAGKSRQEEAIREMNEVSQLSRETLAVVREIVTTMRSVLISEELFQMTQALDSRKMFLLTEGENLSQQLPPTTQNILSACLHECTTNLIRHSNGTRCWVSFWQDENTFYMKVSDDGVLKKAVVIGNGLKGIRERVNEIKGTVNFITQRKFVVQVEIPMNDLEVKV